MSWWPWVPHEVLDGDVRGAVRPTIMTDAPATLDEDDVDLTLRHLTQRFPEDLARALLPEATALEGFAWNETRSTR